MAFGYWSHNLTSIGESKIKPHIKPNGSELWIFSSKEASLHAMPLYKCMNMNAVIAMLNRLKVNKRG